MENSKLMTDIEFLSATIMLDGDHRNSAIDVGGIYLANGKKEYCQDITQSFRKFDGEQTTIELSLEQDELNLIDTFSECNFEIRPEDIISKKPTEASMYIETEEVPTSISLFVKYKGITKAIELTIQ